MKTRKPLILVWFWSGISANMEGEASTPVYDALYKSIILLLKSIELKLNYWYWYF